MTPLRLESAALPSRVKHSTTEPLRSQTLALKNRNFKGPRRLVLLLDYRNQGGWGYVCILKGYNFDHTKLSTHF